MNSPPNTTTDEGGDSGEQMEQKGAGETIGADMEVAGDERTPEVSRMNTRRGRTSMGDTPAAVYARQIRENNQKKQAEREQAKSNKQQTASIGNDGSEGIETDDVSLSDSTDPPDNTGCEYVQKVVDSAMVQGPPKKKVRFV